MKKWLFTASIDGVNVDFETVLESDTEPNFWTCEELAAANGCELWSIERIF